jgi:HK97 family phage portal protein
MKNPFSLLFRARDKPQNAISSAPLFYFGSSNAGKRVTVETGIQLSAVYACIRVISETIASLPLNVYKKDEHGNAIAEDHPLNFILHDEPNAEMTSYIWLEVTMNHLLTYGNAYSQIIRSGRNNVVNLYPLQPDKMTVDRDSSGTLTYTYTDSEGRMVELKPANVLHIPGLGFDGIMGYSPIALEKNAIGLSIAAEEYGSKFFANGARPSGVLKHPGRIKEFDRIRDGWNAAYGGSSNSNKVAILEEGVDFKPITVPNNEAQFLETRKFQVSEICRIFRVPPHMIGDMEHAAFTNIEHLSIDFAMHTIRPWVVRLEKAMNRSLFTDTEKGVYYTHFNIDGLMRGDYKTRMEGYSIGLQNGFMSPNDIRRMENWDPIPSELGGDRYYFNGNMIPMELAGSQYVRQENQSGTETEPNENETGGTNTETVEEQGNDNDAAENTKSPEKSKKGVKQR